MLVMLAGLITMACSDDSDETVAGLVGSDSATAVAQAIEDSGTDAKNDAIGDSGNRKGGSLTCFTLGAMSNFNPISTDYFEQVDNALRVMDSASGSTKESEIKDSAKELLEAWDTVLEAGGLGVELTFGPAETLTNACIEHHSEDLFAPYNR